MAHSSPLFSVVITTFNRPEKLRRAIDSVLNQTFKNFEIIVVNDGSSVSYADIESYVGSNESIRYFYKENEERSIARNFGVKESSGNFICFLDDDDYYLPEHLATLHEKIQVHDFKDGIYHTYSQVLDGENKVSLPELVLYDAGMTISEFYLTKGIITMNSTCASKKILEEFPYDSALVYAEDHNQRLRAMSKYPVFQICKYTNVYDKSGETTTNSKNIKVVRGYIESWKYNFKVPEIQSNVGKKYQDDILNNYYHLMLNNHRLEISLAAFLSYCYKVFVTKPTAGSIKVVFDSLRWRLTRR
jgi:glycosyltransferase involved in cell wall biosynthesis